MKVIERSEQHLVYFNIVFFVLVIVLCVYTLFFHNQVLRTFFKLLPCNMLPHLNQGYQPVSINILDLIILEFL